MKKGVDLNLFHFFVIIIFSLISILFQAKLVYSQGTCVCSLLDGECLPHQGPGYCDVGGGYYPICNSSCTGCTCMIATECMSGYSCLNVLNEQACEIDQDGFFGSCSDSEQNGNCCAPQSMCVSGWSCLNMTSSECTTGNDQVYGACYTGHEAGTCCAQQRICQSPYSCYNYTRTECNDLGGYYGACYTGHEAGTCCAGEGIPNSTPTPTPSPIVCTGEISGQSGYCFWNNFDCISPNMADGNGGCPPTIIGWPQRCCVPSFVPPDAECVGLFGESGECFFVQCPPDYYFLGINPPNNSIGCPSLYACCTNRHNEGVERDALDPQCTRYGHIGINTAVGCIPVINRTSFLSFILPWAIGVGGGTAFVLMIVAGFLIMTSAGDPQRAKAGKELLGGAIAGLLMLIFSVYILDIIGVRILHIPGI